MNKKGFTLIELLAVIIILSLLAVITSVAITKVLKEGKEDLYNTQIVSIKDAAKLWGSDNLDLLPPAGECSYITLKNLQDYGLLDSDITDARNGKKIDSTLKIKISTETTAYETEITNYEVNPTSVSGCNYVYEVQNT